MNRDRVVRGHGSQTLVVHRQIAALRRRDRDRRRLIHASMSAATLARSGRLRHGRAAAQAPNSHARHQQNQEPQPPFRFPLGMVLVEVRGHGWARYLGWWY